MAVFDPRGDGVLRGADEALRQAQSRRASEVGRGSALAGELPALAGPPDAATTASVARVLSEAEGLTPEGRIAFLSVASLGKATASASDPGAPLRKQLETCFPPESESREELGAAIARQRGEEASGPAAGALAAETILRATSVEAFVRPARPAADFASDGMERVRPVSFFETAYGTRARVPTPSAPSLPVTPLPVSLPSKSSLLVQARAAFPAVADSLLVTGRGLESVATHFGSMRSKLEAARARLGDGSGENLRVGYGLREAGEALGAIESHVGAAETRLVREVVPGRPTKLLVAGLGEAQGELRAVAPWAEKAHGELTSVEGMVQDADVPGAIRDVGSLAQEALLAGRELGVVSGQVELLADGTAFEPGAEPAAASESLPSEGEPGVGLTEEDLARIGSGLDPSRPAPQILWTEESVNTTCERGRAQGGVTDAEGHAHLQLAQALLEEASSPVELGPADVAFLLKEAGVPLEKVDPQQLTAAARYASSAATPEEQADRLRKTLDSFQTLARVGAPKLTRQEMVAELGATAKVPTKALEKLSEADVAKTLQQVRSALNGPPGEQQIKVGSYTLKLAVGSGGTVRSSSCKKPGFFSKLGSVLKKAVPVALTVLSFIPATAVFARVAQGAISLVKSIQAKSVLGAVTSAASLVAGGAAAVAKRAVGAAATVAGKAASIAGTTAQKVADVAGGVSRALQGVSSIRQGSVLGGLAAIGSGVAGGIGSFAKGVGDGFSGLQKSLNAVSARLAQAGQAVSTVESYRSAGRAVSEAKSALRQAEASGDRVAIAAAREGLAQAESAKTSAVLGSVASAASLAADVRAGYAKQPGEAVKTPAAKVTLDVALRTAWRGLNVARGIHDRDYAAAGVSALGFAAVGLQAAGKEPANKLGFTDAANLADAALGAHQAGRGEASANAAVEDAERALRVARYTGDPAAIRQAEATLAQARKAGEGALMGGIAASESLLETAATLGEKRHELGEARDLRQIASQRGEQLLSVVQDPRATTAQKKEALAALLRLAEAGTAYEQAVATGDPTAMRLARGDLEAMNDSLRMNPPGSVRVASLGVRDVEPLPGLSESATTSEPATGAYRVSKGDTLWRLAQNYGITVDELLAVNPNLGPDGRIRTGEVIRVPMPERTGTGPGGDEIVTIVIPPPQGSSAPPAGAPSAGAQARSEEGWGSFLEGAIKGDFSDNDSWSKTAGQVVAGVVPFAGQAADARDTLAALNQVREGRPGGWLSLLAAGVGWFPGAGDALKGAIRGGKKVAGEVAEATLEQGARRAGSEAAGEVGERAAHRTSDVGASSTIAAKTTEIRLGDGDVVYRVDEVGRTIEVDAKITGPHRGRAKGHRPEPPGGLIPGEHRGHLAPEGGVDDPRLVNVSQNIISEAPRSNLGPKKVFDNLLSRIAAQNPGAVVRGRHKPLFRSGETRPHAVEHKILVDGKEVHTVVIPNR